MAWIESIRDQIKRGNRLHDERRIPGPRTEDGDALAIIAELSDLVSRDWSDYCKRFVGRCESPIEIQFALAILVSNRGEHDHGWQPQVQIGRYRADFVFEYDGVDVDKIARVAVELDGHDFHEKTKDQASRDKRKDRDLQQAGYNVFRFSGSDVYKDPVACVREVRDFAISFVYRGLI